MKIYKYIAAVLCILALSVSCQHDKDRDTAIEGSWHLTEWNGESPNGMDIYITFASDQTFVLYQKYNSLSYLKFEGTYAIGNGTLTGTYSDGTHWAAAYKYSVSGSTLKLTSESSAETGLSEYSVYTRASIPESILTSALTKSAEVKAML